MKNYTFKINNNNNNIYNKSNETNWSKIIDDLILSNIKDSSPNLKSILDSRKEKNFIESMITDSNSKLRILDCDNCCNINCPLYKAANYINTYKKNTTFPYILGKTYKLSNGTPIIFYDDEIQIGFDTYSYDLFSDFSFIDSLADDIKKTIITIYANGNKITIKL